MQYLDEKHSIFGSILPCVSQVYICLWNASKIFPLLHVAFLLIHFFFAFCKIPFCLDIFNSWELE